MDYANINQGNKTLNFLTGIPSDTSLGGQGTFFSSYKIIVVIWPVGYSKDLSTLGV